MHTRHTIAYTDTHQLVEVGIELVEVADPRLSISQAGLCGSQAQAHGMGIHLCLLRPLLHLSAAYKETVSA